MTENKVFAKQRKLDAKVKHMRANGMMLKDIAKKMGISAPYASYIYNRAKRRDKLAADNGFKTFEQWSDANWRG